MKDWCYVGFEGLAAIFAERYLNGDLIEPGAFTKTLENRSKIFRLLFNHNPSKIAGLIDRLEETDDGLFISGYIPRYFETGKEVIPLLETRALDGLSIGYRAVAAVNDLDQRRLQEIDLWEVSLVTFPMAPRARITRLFERDRATV